MAIAKFEDIIGWQKAQDYAVNIYGAFGHLKDFSFKDQVCRASISISSNIAEGFDRQSNKEFVRFLYIALGSCSETKSLTYLAHRLKYCDEEGKKSLLDQSNEISRIIHGLINSMESNRIRGLLMAMIFNISCLCLSWKVYVFGWLSGLIRQVPLS